jgi:hypothetical protein
LRCDNPGLSLIAVEDRFAKIERLFNVRSVSISLRNTPKHPKRRLHVQRTIENLVQHFRRGAEDTSHH